MATVVLQTAGAALGGALGGPIGAALGRAAGAIAGNIADRALFPPARTVEGPRLDDLRVMGSTEGAALPRLYGRARLPGQLIWALPIEERAKTRDEGQGIKGGGGVSVTEYAYFASFAVALCEGEVSRIGRIWADGQDLDPASVTFRLYPGDESQAPDSLIVAHQGEANAPAYRGMAYVVFERLALGAFGNRLPQLSFEVVRPVRAGAPPVRSVCVIPGATEFGYEPRRVTRFAGWGEWSPENAHQSSRESDWRVSMDQLQAELPGVEHVSLVTAWFGDDLRCGLCTVRPGVDRGEKKTRPLTWSAGGASRAHAREVSRIDGRAAYGGTPSDASVVAAIRDLAARGLAVTFYPFVLMDIAAGNALPDPWGGPRQPAYPWRGRITGSAAPGRPGSPDMTAAAQAQVRAFFGAAEPHHFSIVNGEVRYSGPAEWRYRRMILHYAHLCQLAGGVESFLIGSEMAALTTLREGAGLYPAVAELARLAEEVKAILPTAKISYAADWTEWRGHQPADGSGDFRFHLDPLWASPAVSYVGIDNYMPAADWRDGAGHADAAWGSIHAPGYLEANMARGEGYDWYYADAAGRAAQQRLPITDGAHGKPWVFRFKDIAGWWANPHVNRAGGAEQGPPTAWSPQSKPIRFTEAGCAALDKGANQPNAFLDPKSAESTLAWFSTGARDDLMQRRYLEALHAAWTGPGVPTSSVYGGPMVDAARISVWAWDARPYPAFPEMSGVWGDCANWARGHWLNGRCGQPGLGGLVAELLAAEGFTRFDTSGLNGVLDGFVIDRPMAARDALEQLMAVFAFDAVERGGVLVFRHRAGGAVAALDETDLVETAEDRPLATLTRAHDSDLPAAARIGFVDPAGGFRVSAVEARHNGASLASRRESAIATACVMPASLAEQRAGVALREAMAGRESAAFALPPSRLALEPGDAVTLTIAGRTRAWRIGEIADRGHRVVLARAHEPSVYASTDAADRPVSAEPAPAAGEPALLLLDLPALDGPAGEAPRIAAAVRPWPGTLAALTETGAGATRVLRIDAPATLGTLAAPLAAGPLNRLDRGNRLTVTVISGGLESVSARALLDGANLAAVGAMETGFELIQFTGAQLIGERTYELSGLLRGRFGSEPEMMPERAAGERFVLLDDAVAGLAGYDPGELMGRTLTVRAGASGRDPADGSFAVESVTWRALSLRPLSPVHARVKRLASGDLAIGFTRRTRRGGDGWEQAEAPLAEDAESYAVAIVRDGATVRTLTTGRPEATYTASDQRADHGGALPASVTLSIAQVSQRFGPGAPLKGTFDV
jgi:hypothetical protein